MWLILAVVHIWRLAGGLKTAKSDTNQLFEKDVEGAPFCTISMQIYMYMLGT